MDKEVLEVIRENHEKFFSAEKKVADFVLQNPQKAVDSNVSQLAKHSGVSDATVVRMCHHIGYKGYYQFRITLARDLGKIQYGSVSAVKSKDSVEKVFQEYAEAMLDIGRTIDSEVMWNCVNLLKTCKQAHIMAVGNTSPLAVVQGLELGKEKGLKSIAITAFAQSPVSDLADHVLLSSGKEETFGYYKGYAHLNETAVIDALLNFVTNEELIKTKHADKPEMILSEYKI